MNAEPVAQALAEACAAAMFARDRAAQALGIAIEASGPGFARLGLTVDESMLNGHGTAHGGVAFTFADTAFAYACNSRDTPYVALNATISFSLPVRAGDRLAAVAHERTLAGRTGVYDVTVTRVADGAVVALFRGTCYRISGSVLEAGRES